MWETISKKCETPPTGPMSGKIHVAETITVTERAKVPGGYLVRTATREVIIINPTGTGTNHVVSSEAVCFVPDQPGEEWKLPKAPVKQSPNESSAKAA